MVSKMVNDRQKIADELESWAATHGPAIALAVAAAVAKGVNVEPLLQALRAWMREGIKALVLADEAHDKEGADDAEPRRARDAAAAAVSATLQELREVVAAAYGDAGLAAIGLHDRLPRDTAALERVASRVVALTSADGFKMPPARRKGIRIDVSAFVEDLAPDARALRDALKGVKREEAELQATQTGKDAALDEFDARFTASAGVYRHLASVAGARDLAEKLPTLPRSRRAEEPPEPGPAAPTGGGAPPA